MWEGLLGSLVGAGAKLIPSFFGDSSDQKAEAQFNANYQLQHDLAYHGRTIGARDVMNAYAETGIHPLSLLGLNPASASTVASVGGFGGGNWRKGVADAGQDIGRAISATAGSAERAAMSKLLLEKAGLDNELVRVHIARQVQELSNNAQIGPAMPIENPNRYLIPGQGSTVNTELRSPMAQGAFIKDKAMERTRVNPDTTYAEPGAVPGIGYIRMPDGRLMAVKSEDAQKRLEDDIPGNLKHFLLRTFGPMFNPKAYQPGPPPPGYRWRVDAVGDYHLVPLTQRLKGPGWRD